MNLFRIVKLGATNFYRNLWLSSTASFMMILTLMIVGFFLVLSLLGQQTTAAIEEKIDLIAYFYDNASDNDIQIISQQLQAREDVKSVIYVDKEQALKIWRQRNQSSPQIRDLINENENPLPRSLEVKTKDPEKLSGIASFLAGDSYKSMIRRVSYQENKATVERLIRLTKMISEFGWSLSAIFIIISVLVLYNTIRLTIFSRKAEIEIMRLVGASDPYIRLPFVIESMLYGVVATIVSLILISIIIFSISPFLTNYLGDLNVSPGDFYTSHLWLVFLVELTIGIGISIVCSLLAIKKYLKK